MWSDTVIPNPVPCGLSYNFSTTSSTYTLFFYCSILLVISLNITTMSESHDQTKVKLFGFFLNSRQEKSAEI